MKSLKILIIAFGIVSTAYAQRKYTVTGTRFLLPLFEKFNEPLEQEGFDKLFEITSRNPKADITATATPNVLPTAKEGYKQTALAKIVYLPVINTNHPDIKSLLAKGIRVDELKSIFFKDKGDAGFKPNSNFNVLTRRACAAVSFSSFLKEDIKTLVNDYDKIENDSLLIDLVAKDTLGITFLDPSNIYDINTGKIKQGITVLPIDLNNNGTIDSDENFYADRKVLIERLKKDNIELPSGLLTVTILETEKASFSKYVNWVKEKGDLIIENFGFLPLN